MVKATAKQLKVVCILIPFAWAFAVYSIVSDMTRDDDALRLLTSHGHYDTVFGTYLARAIGLGTLAILFYFSYDVAREYEKTKNIEHSSQVNN